MNKRTYLLACALLCASFARTAHAQHYREREWLDANHLDIKLQLGFGGALDATVDTGLAEVTGSADLDVSVGLAAQYLVPVHRYFAIGGLAGFLTWQSEAGSSRNVAFDLAALPEGKFAVLRDLELYVAMPIGLSIDVLNEVERGNTVLFPGGSVAANISGGAAPGFVIGGLFGVRYQIARKFGLLGELGFMYRTFGHTISGDVNGRSQDLFDVSVSFTQFVMNFGVYF